MLVCLSVSGSAQKVSNGSTCGVWHEDQFLRCSILSSRGAFVNDCAMQNLINLLINKILIVFKSLTATVLKS